MLNGENLPVITGKFMNINKNQYAPRKKMIFFLKGVATY
jgi:hypothetical protein